MRCCAVLLGGLILSSCVLRDAAPTRVPSAHEHRSWMDERRRAFLGAHPETDPETANAILKGRLRTPMSAEEVRASWGDPDATTGDPREHGRVEYWEYREAFEWRRARLTRDAFYLLVLTDGRLDKIIRSNLSSRPSSDIRTARSGMGRALGIAVFHTR